MPESNSLLASRLLLCTFGVFVPFFIWVFVFFVFVVSFFLLLFLLEAPIPSFLWRFSFSIAEADCGTFLCCAVWGRFCPNFFITGAGLIQSSRNEPLEQMEAMSSSSPCGRSSSSRRYCATKSNACGFFNGTHGLSLSGAAR